MPADSEQVMLHLRRILESNAFRNAARLRAFLRYVVEETLAGREAGIKEYSIGCEVCGRPASFDPKTDPIVRVDANRLRSRLETYYSNEGTSDDLLIDLPRGAYIPTFRTCCGTTIVEDLQPSLAVRPFVNLILGTEHEYLADSLTEELIHRLARVNGLRVIARSSSFQFKDSTPDAREVGKRLSVKYVLEGSVHLAGARLRVTAQLIDSRNGWILWSEKYERAWQEIHAMQDEIAASITDALALHLVGASGPALFQHVTDNPDAYADYLRGRYAWNQRTQDSLTQSVQYYERALARDPLCAAAYAGLADTLTVMALNDQKPALSVMPRANAAARRALELRPGWPEALTSSGFVKSVFNWDWEGGARDFEQAIHRQPGCSTAHYLYGIANLLPRGRYQEAIDSIKTALGLDPVSPVLFRDLGLVHFMRRSWDEAAICWQHAETLAPSYRGCLYWRARLYMQLGSFDQALATLQARLGAGPANTRVLATIACIHARCGAIDKAAAVLGELSARAHTSRVSDLDFATVHLGSGRLVALDHLEKACEQREAALYQFGVDPFYDHVRAHPRAVALRLAMNLPGNPAITSDNS